jgi:hypothetical protein
MRRSMKGKGKKEAGVLAFKAMSIHVVKKPLGNQ